jgi:hypothetical protein
MFAQSTHILVQALLDDPQDVLDASPFAFPGGRFLTLSPRGVKSEPDRDPARHTNECAHERCPQRGPEDLAKRVGNLASLCRARTPSVGAGATRRAHPSSYGLVTPADSARSILDAAEIINHLWGSSTPGGRLYPAPIRREILAVGARQPVTSKKEVIMTHISTTTAAVGTQ